MNTAKPECHRAQSGEEQFYIQLFTIFCLNKKPIFCFWFRNKFNVEMFVTYYGKLFKPETVYTHSYVFKYIFLLVTLFSI